MNKEQFDRTWKIGVLVALIISIAVLGYEMRDFSVNGISCQKDPFTWGVNKVVEMNDYASMNCNCFLGHADPRKMPTEYSFGTGTEATDYNGNMIFNLSYGKTNSSG